MEGGKFRKDVEKGKNAGGRRDSDGKVESANVGQRDDSQKIGQGKIGKEDPNSKHVVAGKPSTGGLKIVLKKEDPALKANGVKREAAIEPSKKVIITSSAQKNSGPSSKPLVAKGAPVVINKPKAESSSGVAKAGVSTVTKTTKTVTVTKVTKTEEKKEKKVFTLPGQKHEAPEERDPLRIFYESLHEQIPTSDMAQVWMMEHGLLPNAQAKDVLERKQKRQQDERNGTPLKIASSAREINGRSVAKALLPNGNSKNLTLQKGKSKRDMSSSDDELYARPVKRKFK